MTPALPQPLFSRRAALRLAGRAALAGAFAAESCFATSEPLANDFGAIAGEPAAEQVGLRVLAAGGNAIDAAVSAALAASVASPHNCGPGGYGGCMVIAQAGTHKVTAIDFNTTAPAAWQPDTFPLDEKGGVRGQVNEYGWLSVGVPGTLAGLQLALDRFGSHSFAEAAAPAIKLAREGFPVTTGMAAATRGSLAWLRKDPATARLLLKDGQPLPAGASWRNPELADLLETLARRGSVESFYRGDIARRIADAFQKNGGLVRFADLAAYEAREVTPLIFDWRGFTVHTAPLTAGGLTVLQALSILKELDWPALPAGAAKTHAKLEALRMAWQDRLTLLGDPEHVTVPVPRLLSRDYSREAATRVRIAVKSRRPLAAKVQPRPQGGTVNLSVADRAGNLVALTLTHGEAFGARVTVEGLGLTLGHGLSRFDPGPGHPNSPGPRKRPLHNMCPTIVSRSGRPVLALGGAGGRRIPNSLFEVLTQIIVKGAPFDAALAAPRLHTEGDLTVRPEKAWPVGDMDYLKSVGYQVVAGNSAKIGAASFDPFTQACRAAWR